MEFSLCILLLRLGAPLRLGVHPISAKGEAHDSLGGELALDEGFELETPEARPELLDLGLDADPGAALSGWQGPAKSLVSPGFAPDRRRAVLPRRRPWRVSRSISRSRASPLAFSA